MFAASLARHKATPQLARVLQQPAQRGFFSSRDQVESRRRTPSHLNLGFAVLVGQEYACMLHRFEKFHSKLEPGLRFKFPYIDSVEFVHDLRE